MVWAAEDSSRLKSNGFPRAAPALPLLQVRNRNPPMSIEAINPPKKRMNWTRSFSNIYRASCGNQFRVGNETPLLLVFLNLYVCGTLRRRSCRRRTTSCLGCAPLSRNQADDYISPGHLCDGRCYSPKKRMNWTKFLEYLSRAVRRRIDGFRVIRVRAFPGEIL
jgi:hypothetical protein